MKILKNVAQNKKKMKEEEKLIDLFIYINQNVKDKLLYNLQMNKYIFKLLFPSNNFPEY
jgi:hypothetical protein